MIPFCVRTTEHALFVSDMIQPGDQIRVLDDFDFDTCHSCDYDIGIDDDMYNYTGDVLTVKCLHPFMVSNCKGMVFSVEENEFYWTVHWISEYYPLVNPLATKPAWEV